MSNQFKSAPFTIAIFGEILADIFADSTVLGGAPYNVARHLRALQQHPLLISRVGNDPLKATLFSELAKLDIDQSAIQLDSTYPTGQVIVHMENSEHRFEIEPNQAYDHIHPTNLITQPDIAYFGTLAQRSAKSSLALDAFLNNVKCPRFLDINLRAPWYNKDTIQRALLRAEIVKTNEEELKIICDMFEPVCSNDKDRALFLLKKFALQYLFVTCGEHGAWVLSEKGEEKAKGQALNSALIDTVGAGDAFSAICMVGFLHGWPMQKILTRASTFASALCTVQGAAPETHDFYLPYIESWF
jgi:fructokinase